MLSLTYERLKEKDKLNLKAINGIPQCPKGMIHPQYISCLFFTVIQNWVHLTTSLLIITSPTFPLNHVDLVQSMTDCLYSKCIHCITDCVMTKTEKLGQKYHEALRISRDPQFDR